MNVTIAVLSFHVYNTPIQVLQNLSFSNEEIAAFGHLLKQQNDISEAVLVATCNRTEIYFSTQNPEKAHLTLLTLLAEFKNLQTNQLLRYSKFLQGKNTVQHLFETTAGLKSLAIGESEIQGQIKNAYYFAKDQQLARHHLCPLFEAAIRAGKCVRSATGLARFKISLSTVTLDYLFEQQSFDPSTTRVGILGTGKMARSALNYLVEKGFRQFTLLSKNPEQRAKSFDLDAVQIMPFTELPQLLQTTDLMFCAYGTAELFIRREQLQTLLESRSRPLYIIDIAMPRDVDPAVADLPGVYLLDFDSLERENVNARIHSNGIVQQARAIIRQELKQFFIESKQRELGSAILTMRQHFEAIGQAELQKTLRGLAHLPETDQQKIKKLSHSIIHKILHQPTITLRSKAAEGDAETYLQLIEDLFEIKFQSQNLLEKESLN